MPTDPFFRMPIEDVFHINNRGTVVTGAIKRGTIKVDDEVYIKGSKYYKKTMILGIEMFRKKLSHAKTGDNVGLILKDVNKEDVQGGDLLMGSGIDH